MAGSQLTAKSVGHIAREFERKRYLKCVHCGVECYPDAVEVRRFVRYGWPKCCGELMRIKERKEAE